MNGHRRDLTDQDILAVISPYTAWGTGTIRSFLSKGRPNLRTASVLGRLLRMRREGKVNCIRVRSRFHWSTIS